MSDHDLCVNKITVPCLMVCVVFISFRKTDLKNSVRLIISLCVSCLDYVIRHNSPAYLKVKV